MGSMRRIRAIVFLASLCGALLPAAPGWSEPAPASADSAYDGDEPRIHATLLVDLDPTRTRGSVGVLFDIDPGWHLYWRNPGDSGLAPELAFEFSRSGVAVGELEWPAPHEFREDVDLLTWGYSRQVLLAAPIELREGSAGGRVRVEADVLVCAGQCLPATFVLERDFEPAPERQRAATQALFEHYALRVPASAGERGLHAELASPLDDGAGALRIRCLPGAECAIEGLAAERMSFFPYAPHVYGLRTAGIQRESDGALRVALDASPPERLEPGDRTLRGVLVLEGRDDRRAFDVALALPAPGSARSDAAPAFEWNFLLRALAFGFLGGLLLNLMPCVLPVLAIKVFAIAELADRGRGAGLAHAGAYAAGILSSLLALALVVVGLRWSGSAVGWGFHLQEPVFVAAVVAVLVVFALNLLGVFELAVDTGRLGGIGSEASGTRRSFFDGLLAVVLATPCSAPFLGTAVGFAFASPAPVILAIFTAIGLGLAAPFVAIALVPRSSRFIPRSGPWMVELRRALGFALLLSAVWLTWVFGRTSGVDAMAGLLVLLLALAFGTWMFGWVQRTGRRAPVSLLLSGALVIFLAGVNAIDLHPLPPTRTAEVGTTRAYSPEALAASLAEGRPAFVYFTADWCLTCKVNERRVLSDPRARAALASNGFDVFRADWTRRDETIRAELAKLGKAGVPVYALYPPDGDATPRLLSEILQLDGFIANLEEVAAQTRSASR